MSRNIGTIHRWSVPPPPPPTTSSETWISDTCDLLSSNSWPHEKPVCLAMSSFVGLSSEMQENGMVSILEALSKNSSARILKCSNITLELLPSSTTTTTSNATIMHAFQAMLTNNKSLRSILLHNIKVVEFFSSSSSMSLPTEVFTNVNSANLEELIIKKCKLDKKACTALGMMILRLQSIRTLTLSDSVIDKFHLLDAIAVNNSLACLSLENLNFGLKEAHRLASILEQNKCLACLSLQSNNLNGKAIKILVEEGLVYNDCLQSLSLAYNPVGDDGAVSLTEYLVKQDKFGKQLKYLDVSNAEIWHKGCVVLSKGLSRMNNVVRLDLDGNEIENCASELLKSVVRNMTIKHISGVSAFSAMASRESNKDDNNTTFSKVEFFLRLNRANRRMLSSPTSLSLWPLVLERCNNDPDVLFHVLSQAPYIAQRKR